MRCKGTLEKISLNFGTGRREITLAVDAKAEDIERYMAKDLAVEIKQYRKKRSLEANAYYWQLISQISRAIGQSSPWIHNQALRKCGYLETVDGQAIYIRIPNTDQAVESVDEETAYHLAPTSEYSDDGGSRIYMMLRGSHTFDTAEMSHLIDTAVEWAKDLGIETMTPDQLEEMMALYDKKHNPGKN